MSSPLFTVRRRDLAWAVVLVVLLSGIWVAQSNRANAALVVPPGTGIARVYVAVGTNYPDALGVGPGAGVNGAPIIVLPTNPPIPAASSAELVRLDPRSVVIVGGTGVISAAMETALGVLLQNAEISRIGGANRYETNAMFSESVYPVEAWASIPAAAFTGIHPATDDVGIGTSAYNTTNGVLSAPIQLPHGAEILELKADVFDADGSQDITIDLERVDDTGSALLFASTGTSFGFSDGFTTVSTTTITPAAAIVDNENYAYSVEISGADGGPQIINVMVRYRLGVLDG